MDNHHTTAVVLFVVSFMLLACAYIAHLEDTIKMDNKEYAFAGMMQYTNPTDGKLLFTPVYSKVN